MVDLLREKSAAMNLPLSAVHLPLQNLEESLKRAYLRSVSSAGLAVRPYRKIAVNT